MEFTADELKLLLQWNADCKVSCYNDIELVNKITKELKNKNQSKNDAQCKISSNAKISSTLESRILFKKLEEALEEKRFFIDSHEKFFEFYIGDLLNNPYILEDKIYYRARINEKNEVFKNEELCAPPQEKCNYGRLNPKGIRYLYLSSEIKTCVSEVRPWIGSVVEIGKFTIKDNKKLIIKDFIPRDEEETHNRAIYNLKNVLNEKFSKPVSGSNSDLDYLVTQCIAEYIRDYDKTIDGKPYDGIAYESSANKGGRNFLIFEPENMEIVGLAGRVKISNHEIDYPNIEYNFEEEKDS